MSKITIACCSVIAICGMVIYNNLSIGDSEAFCLSKQALTRIAIDRGLIDSQNIFNTDPELDISIDKAYVGWDKITSCGQVSKEDNCKRLRFRFGKDSINSYEIIKENDCLGYVTIQKGFR